MITGNIEFHDDHAILAVLCDELTEDLNKRLEADVGRWLQMATKKMVNGTHYSLSISRL